MESQQEFIKHSFPLKRYLGEYGRLIDVLCEDVPNLPRIPQYVREGAKRIIKLVRSYYPTQGRRRIAIVIIALGIARGNYSANDLDDLLYRARHFRGEEIPQGQIRNTFEDLRTFLRHLLLYKQNRKCDFNHFSIQKEDMVYEKCPECGSINLVHNPETGEDICAVCGLVLNENIN